MDLHVEVPLVEFRELSSGEKGESSEVIRRRVVKAREMQARRLGAGGTNAGMSARQVKQHCCLNRESNTMLGMAMEQLNFSARAYDRILKVARTLADLAGEEEIGTDQVLEAIQYRAMDRKLFG